MLCLHTENVAFHIGSPARALIGWFIVVIATFFPSLPLPSSSFLPLPSFVYCRLFLYQILQIPNNEMLPRFSVAFI